MKQRDDGNTTPISAINSSLQYGIEPKPDY
jgi:hypothetical protein